MAEILLVGTVHNDIRGSERLEKIIDSFNPDFISVEITPLTALHRLRSRQKTEKFISDPFKIARAMKKLEKQFSTQSDALKFRIYNPELDAYELFVPYKHRQKTGIRVGLDDDPEIIKKLETEEESVITQIKPIDLDQIGTPGTKQYSDRMDHLYKLPAAEAYYVIALYSGLTSNQAADNADHIAKFLEASDDINHQRDKFAEQRIRKHAEKYDRILRVSGLYHVFQESDDRSDNLFQLLSDLNPKRMKLIEADSLV